MGRIKVFLRSFCLTGGNDQSQSEPAFDQGIDVSHLAEPHITSSPSQIYEQASPPNQNSESNNDEQPLSSNGHHRATPNSYVISVPSSQRNSLLTSNHDDGSSFARPASSSHLENNSSQPSSPPYASSPSNIYEPQNDQYSPPTPEPPNQNVPQPPNQPSPAVAPRDAPVAGPSFGGPTKLSYDIISVREPLAKILAERQQLIQTQQQQRQLLGEHDYIEVYGERGSSCFYEEIAGSVTSSATYDQIGANSNHNYQVLINAYAVANRQPASNQDNENARTDNNPATSSNGSRGNQEENAYDVTSHPSDQVDGPSTSSRADTGPSQAPTPSKTALDKARTKLDGEENSQQSIPVYSVINKATRRSNTNMRNNLNEARPPKPPPKNPPISLHHQQQQSPNGNNSFDSSQASSSISSAWTPSHQLPSTSSFLDRTTGSNQLAADAHFNPSIKTNTHRNVRLPQPPPRLSKHSALNHTMDRPLPSPSSNFDNLHNNNNGNMLDRNNAPEDDDIESINNGYELLKSNMEEDQIDVGYEKIKESNRYSGGSISSQLYQRQLIDNGGYESVQPIYSSPSNALVEPNYEAIAPATASELAAAATAKLNAAASVIEQILKKDQ